MPERTCDLCGWPIEEWQRAQDLTDPRFDPYDIIVHANPADHRPTRRPGDVSREAISHELFNPSSGE